ncbi:unnamed protein product [Symbiodinium necroappetens]|uniref:Reverse transcriptase domain-containing protein n=1 Tax=Symbiodinium necroappetens TaxID=1628268 RepID=A0A812L7V2_9DINO|nr:unnamed protein product [Symbiodinium necroappetens]
MLESGPCLLLVYVDDFLCIAPTKEDVDRIFGVIEKRVELKRTDVIRSSQDGGGSLRFIGRVISRREGESSITVSLPEDYLDETFKAYGLSGKGSVSPPDVSVHVEKEGGLPLSPEAYSRYLQNDMGAIVRTTKRRGISGGVRAVDGFVVKTLCRHQQLVSLSSMESELFALQSVAQDSAWLSYTGNVLLAFKGRPGLGKILNEDWDTCASVRKCWQQYEQWQWDRASITFYTSWAIETLYTSMPEESIIAVWVRYLVFISTVHKCSCHV